jgi:hypothetical protein
MINVEAREVLDQIAAKEPHELNETEIEFLKARRYYLTYEMQIKFKHILQGVSDVKPEDAEFNDVPDELKDTPTEEVARVSGTVVNPTDPGLATDAQSVIEEKSFGTSDKPMTKAEAKASKKSVNTRLKK